MRVDSLRRGLFVPSGRFRRPAGVAGLIMSITSYGGWRISGPDWLDSKLTLPTAESNSPLTPGVYGAVSMTCSPTAMPAMRSGSWTGGTPAVMSFSSWRAGMRRRDASSAWLQLPATGLTLLLRLPDCMAEEYGKHLVIVGVRFAYGHEQVVVAVHGNAEFAANWRQHGEKPARATGLGQAISCRFKRDARGCRVFATWAWMFRWSRTAVMASSAWTYADHLAGAESDASGNCVKAWRVPWYWPVGCSGARSASRASGSVPLATAFMSLSMYP